MDIDLIPPREEDAGAWARWRGEARSRRMNPFRPASIEELTARLRACRSDLGDRTASEYRWMVRAGGEIVGTVTAFNFSRPMGHTEIGYMIGARHHGRGIGTRAVKLLVDRLFSETDLHRVFATVSVHNEPSVRLLERLGFRREGVLREHFVIEGERTDEIVFALLRPEWEVARRS